MRQAFTLVLTILAVNPTVGRAVFHVSCPGASRGCAAIEAHPELVTAPTPFVCLGGTASWWDLTLTGRVDGRPFRSHVQTCWTPQMTLIGRLGIARGLQSHLVPRRREAVVPGTTRRIPAGRLRPGDLVTCTVNGHLIPQGVPVEAEQTASTGDGTTLLSVTRHADGSVTAACT